MGDYKSIVNEELRHGPVVERRCTDILCCILFLVFLVAMFGIGVYGFQHGDPKLVLYPYDSSGNQCGTPDSSTDSYNYVYYAAASRSDSFKSFSGYRVCLKHCPSQSSFDLECYNNSQVTCPPGKNYFLLNHTGDFVKVQPYTSDELWKRFCAPDNVYSFFSGVMDDIYVNGMEDWVADICRCWTAMFIIMAVAVAVSIVYLILLRYCVGFILWTSILATVLLFLLFGYYIQITADQDYKAENKKKTREALHIASYIVYASVGIFCLLVLFMYKRIQLAIAIMKSGAIFLRNVPSILLVPIAMFLVSVAFLIYWVFAIVYIYSTGDLKKTNSVVARISWDDSTRNALYFEIVGIIWINSMKIALTQFIIACTVCIWYFKRDKASWGSVCTSTYYAFRYHLGTLAFGSLLLSVVKIIKYILWYLQEKVYKSGFEGNKFVKCACKCIQCYVLCFERFIKFIDKNAYIQTALTGDGFCVAAKNAFALIVENALRFAALGAIGDIFKVLGKIFITCGSSYIGFLIITNIEPYKSDVQSPIPPTCVFGVISYVIAGIFMSIYEMACDTIIQAYLVDEKLNLNSVEFAPEPLREFMTEHKSKEDKSGCCGCC